MQSATERPAQVPAIEPALMAAILDSLTDPVVFVDTGHVIRYLNRTGAADYPEGQGLVGKSVLDCHSATSCEVIREVLAAIEAGEDERLIRDSPGLRIFMRAVRDPAGKLLGYFERFERPAASA